MDRLNAMGTFIAVVDAGSFSGAARVLDIGQSSVSKTVAQLEKHLEVRLLIRSTRGLTPTEAGQAFYDHARRSIEEADEAEIAARGAASSLTGLLRVSAAVTFARLHILPHLGIFMAEHPNLAIDIILDDRNIDLMEEGIDVSLRMGNLSDSNMTARHIARSPRIVVGTPAYFSRAGIPRVPGDLSEHQAITYAKIAGDGVCKFVRDGIEASVSVSGKLRINAAEGVRATVLSGLGIAISSEWMFSPELQAGDVKQVLGDWSLPPVDLWAVFPSGRMVNAKSRAFVEFIEQLMHSENSKPA